MPFSKRASAFSSVLWGVILEREGELLPTNAYALLTGEGYEFAWCVQCGVFRGTGRSVFLDRREFDGSVVDQVEQAYQYVLSRINMGANFDQIVAFGLREPEFLVDDEDFRVNVYRMSLDEFGKRLDPLHDASSGDVQIKERNKDARCRKAIADGTPISTDGTPMDPRKHRWDTDWLNLTKRERDIISLFDKDDAITTANVADLLELGMDRSKEIVRGLVMRGVLMKHGNGRYTHYTLAGRE